MFSHLGLNKLEKRPFFASNEKRPILPATRSVPVVKMSASGVLCRVPRELLDCPASDNLLNQIARKLTRWEEVAPWLQLDEAQEVEVRANFRNYSDQKRQVLRKWRQINGHRATYRQLIIVLSCAENNALAENVADLLLTAPRETIIGPKTTMGVLGKFREYLVDCYKTTRHPSHEQWPMLNMSHYVDLAMVEVPVNASSQGEGEEAEVVVKEVHLSEIFRSSHKASRKFVLIQGPPGSGKTTLTWHISQKWAEGKLFQQFSLLIPISLANADPSLLNATCLADIIPHESKEMRENVAKAIIDRNGKGVCFLIDSWDEAPPTFYRNQQSYFVRLLKGACFGKKFLPHCSIVITSRPVAMLPCSPTSSIFILGFNAYKIEEFIDVSMHSDADKEKLIQTLQERAELYALCHVPLNINIIVHLFKTSRGNLPSTLTELYTALVCNELIRHRSLRMGGGTDLDEISDVQILPEDIATAFKALCQLAYTGIKMHQSSFNLKTIQDCGIRFLSKTFPDTLSLMTSQQQITSFGKQYTYMFQHYTIQEYLAAQHLAQLNQEQQKKAVEELLRTSPLTRTLPFYAGLTKLGNRGVLDVLLKVTKQPLDLQAVQKQLMEHVNEPGSDYRRLFLALINCIYESKNHQLYKSVHPPVTKRSFGRVWISLHFLHLTQADCLSLGCFLKHEDIPSLALEFSQPSNGRFKLLVQDVVNQKRCKPNILLIVYSIFARELMSIRMGFGKIIFFSMINCCSKFDAYLALKYLIDGVAKSPGFLCLQLANCSITSEHKYYLLLLMTVSRSLTTFHLSYSNISGSISVLSAGFINSEICDLTLQNCSLNDTDLSELTVAVSHPDCKLTVLAISGNNFSPIEFTTFLSTLLSSQLQTVVYDKKLNTEQDNILYTINQQRKIEGKPPLEVSLSDRRTVTDYDVWEKAMSTLPPDK